MKNVPPNSREERIFKIERPEKELLFYYMIAVLAWGPAAPAGWVVKFLRYRTLRYSFTEEGVSMSWGAFFRREIHLAYTRIQDIQLSSNVVERWLGLARIDIQTASGKAKAELTIEGLSSFLAIRDFLYARMRGAQISDSVEKQEVTSREPNSELAAVLKEVADEVRALREGLAAKGGGSGDV